jgi:hypothetical protein
MRWRLLCLALAGLGCATAYPAVDVTVEVDPETDFAGFQTFAQAEPPWKHPVVGERVHQEIEREFESKGYQPARVDEADLVVVFRARSVRSVRQQMVPDPETFYYYQLERYIEGTLDIDVFDARQEKRIWQGTGKVDIDDESQAEKAAARAVAAVLADFPERGSEPAGRP